MPFARLPEQVRLAWTTGDLPAALHDDELRAVAGAVASRRREFATTRAMAREALARAGGPTVPIPAGPDRAPRWPNGWRGSLTHCAGFRAAAVAPAAAVAALGIDAEPLAVLPVPVAATVLEECERRCAAALGPFGAVTAFSAKESLFKAWYPVTGDWLGFEDARLVDARSDAGGRWGTLMLEITASRPAPLRRWPGPRAVEAAWDRGDGRVHTSVSVLAPMGGGAGAVVSRPMPPVPHPST